MARCARGRSSVTTRPVPEGDGGVSMVGAMSVNARPSLRRPRTASRAVAALLATAALLAALCPAWALGGGITDKNLGITVPASARVHGTTSTPTATTTPAATAPASPQPGTVAPPTTTPASALPHTTSTPAATVPATTTPATTTPPASATPGAPATSSTTVVGVARKSESHPTHLSALALVLAILGALLILGCIAWAVGRWLALEPRWTVSLMHSLRESSYRASETWAEFSDWARLGR